MLSHRLILSLKCAWIIFRHTFPSEMCGRMPSKPRLQGDGGPGIHCCSLTRSGWAAASSVYIFSKCPDCAEEVSPRNEHVTSYQMLQPTEWVWKRSACRGPWRGEVTVPWTGSQDRVSVDAVAGVWAQQRSQGNRRVRNVDTAFGQGVRWVMHTCVYTRCRRQPERTRS